MVNVASECGLTPQYKRLQALHEKYNKRGLVILGFLVIAFRKSPHPVRYGTAAIVAMLHDLLVTVGVFSIFSLLFGWEADALVLSLRSNAEVVINQEIITRQDEN